MAVSRYKACLISDIRPGQLEPIILSHGWINLPPFERVSGGFTYAFALDSKTAIDIRVVRTRKQIQCYSDIPLSLEQRKRIKTTLSRVLSLDFPAAGLIRDLRIRQEVDLLKLARRGWGRMLRAATPWEDAVKTLCTTNASWPHTIQMCQALVKSAGLTTVSSTQAFPGPSHILSMSAGDRHTKLKLGYRLPYLLSLAERALGEDKWLMDTGASLPKAELEERISRWSGFGPYARNHFTVLMGVHSTLPIDREVAKHLGIRKQGKKLRIKGDLPYAEWGEFQFTVYKLTRIARRLNWIGD